MLLDFDFNADTDCWTIPAVDFQAYALCAKSALYKLDQATGIFVVLLTHTPVSIYTIAMSNIKVLIKTWDPRYTVSESAG